MKRRMKDKEKRRHTVSVRLNDREMELLNAMRGKLPKGEALRAILINSLPQIVPESNLQAADELRRIGLNINQIARYAHQGIAPEIEQTRALLLELRIKMLGGGQ